MAKALKICLAFVIFLSPINAPVFGQRSISVEAEIGARAETDTTRMCNTLMDSRITRELQLDARTQNHGHLPIIRLAMRDGGFRSGLQGLSDYSVAFSGRPSVAGDAARAGAFMDESNRMLQTRSYRLRTLLNSRGYQKAIDDCASRYGVPSSEVDQLMRAVLGDVDSTTLIGSRVLSFLATAYAFNKVLDLLSRRVLRLPCDHWFMRHRNAILGVLSFAFLGGSIAYGHFMNEEMQAAADGINEHGVGGLINDLNSTEIQPELEEDVRAYVDLVQRYQRFHQANPDATADQFPPELLARLDFYMAKRPAIEEQIGELEEQAGSNSGVARYLDAAKGMVDLTKAHEDYWRAWQQTNSTPSSDPVVNRRQQMLRVLFEHQAILNKPSNERSADDYARLDVLREQIRGFQY